MLETQCVWIAQAFVARNGASIASIPVDSYRGEVFSVELFSMQFRAMLMWKQVAIRHEKRKRGSCQSTLQGPGAWSLETVCELLRPV